MSQDSAQVAPTPSVDPLALAVDSAVTENQGPEALQKAREHGWMEGITIDYNAITDAAPEWASSAAVYEWSGDAGEVGEASATLEVALFESENQQRAGEALGALNLTVTQEGPVKVSPVTMVSEVLHIRHSMLTWLSSRMPVSTQSCLRTSSSAVMTRPLLFRLTVSLLFSRAAISSP